ncbi:MAG: hypothetical protein KJ831_02535 [Candidatus Eisenbacteria bacterium]|nr:hypothetical protein [Candidatus Eisenbacteria bacterium]
MNLPGLYDSLFLRDFLAFVLPGGISLYGLTIAMRGILGKGWNLLWQYLGDPPNSYMVVMALLLSFLFGHILDLLYRVFFQGREMYRRKMVAYTMLRSDFSESDPRRNHAKVLRKKLIEFWGIDPGNIDIDNWINQDDALKEIMRVRNWIQVKDQQIYNAEIGRASLQAHALFSSALSFWFLAICWIVSQAADGAFCASGTLIRVFVISLLLIGIGVLYAKQGSQKRKVVVENSLKLFGIMWPGTGAAESESRIPKATQGSLEPAESPCHNPSPDS